MSVAELATRIAAWSGDNAALVSAGGLLLGVALADWIQRRVVRRLAATAERTHSVWDDVLVAGFGAPVSLAIWVLGGTLALRILGSYLGIADALPIAPVRTIGLVAAVVWFGLRLAGGVEDGLIRQFVVPGAEVGPDRTTIEALGKVARVVVVVAGALVALQSLGFSVSGVVAFGGLGGLAVGFAARDLLANLFGGIIVHVDRPFAVGDWIRSPEREIEGTVETIGWRVTRVRTFDMRPVYVPNAVFASVVVENPSRMSHRRIFETVGVRYQDVDRVDGIVAAVRSMLEARDEVDGAEPLIVNLNRYGPSALELMVYCLVTETRWVPYHAIKQEIMLAVVDIVRSHGAEIAYPTSTLHVASLPGGAPTQGASDVSPRPDPAGETAGASP